MALAPAELANLLLCPMLNEDKSRAEQGACEVILLDACYKHVKGVMLSNILVCMYVSMRDTNVWSSVRVRIHLNT